MPDLERQAVMDWIAVREPTIAFSHPAPIGPVEDETEIQAALVALGSALDRQADSNTKLSVCLRTGAPGQDLAAVLSQLGPARLFRLLDWLGTGDDDRTEALRALLAGEYAPASALRAMFQALHRQELLHRMFSEHRLALLLAATKIAREGVDA